MATDPSLAFVSYSRADSKFVVRLVKDLKARGVKVWMDHVDIHPGQRWEEKVEIALKGCPRMLVILSPASVSSRNVMAEAAYAIDKDKEVIPVLYLECEIPFRLLPFQYADFRTSYEEGLESLLATMSAEQETVEPPATTSITSAYLAVGERQHTEQNQEKQKAEQALIEQQTTNASRIIQQHRIEPESQEPAQQFPLEQDARERRVASDSTLPRDKQHKKVLDKVTFGAARVEPTRVEIDELDRAWEEERLNRERELSKALLKEWEIRGKGGRDMEETELIKKLRLDYSEWVSQRPPGFESRQIQRQEQQRAETQSALNLWQQRRAK